MREPRSTYTAGGRAWQRVMAGALALALVSGAAAGLSAQGTSATPPAIGSGLAVPRFVSLKSDRVNLRHGPGTEYPTAWVFRRAGLPVEVIKEFESWRQVRDSEGTTGWAQRDAAMNSSPGRAVPVVWLALRQRAATGSLPRSAVRPGRSATSGPS